MIRPAKMKRPRRQAVWPPEEFGLYDELTRRAQKPGTFLLKRSRIPALRSITSLEELPLHLNPEQLVRDAGNEISLN